MVNPSSETAELWARMRQPGTPGYGASGLETGSTVNGRWQPVVDIVEESDRFRVQADVPGIGVEHLEVTLIDGILSIRGARDTVIHERVTGYHHLERPGGAFHRQFVLPDNADPARIRVQSRDGVLEIEILKRPVSPPPGRSPGR